MGRPNPQNLIVPTSEQARINGAKGGKQKAINAEKAKTWQSVFKAISQAPVNGKKIDTIQEAGAMLGIDVTEISPVEAMAIVAFAKGVNGDLDAIKMCRDTCGEKPTDKQEHTFNNLPDIMLVKSKCKKK